MDNSTQPTLSDYADTLIKEKNFATLTPETYKEIKQDVLTRLNDYLMSKVIAHMSDAQTVEFNKLMEQNPTDEQLQAYIATTLPDAGVFIGDTLISFRKIYLGLE